MKYLKTTNSKPILEGHLLLWKQKKFAKKTNVKIIFSSGEKNQTKTIMEELQERIEEMKKCAIYQVFPKGHRVLVDWERQISVLEEAYDILEGFRDAEDRYGQDD